MRRAIAAGAHPAAARATIEQVSDVTACAAEVARIHNAAYASDAAFRLYSPE